MGARGMATERVVDEHTRGVDHGVHLGNRMEFDSVVEIVFHVSPQYAI